jgi:hypothetical protein
MLLRNVEIQLPSDAPSYTRRTKTSKPMSDYKTDWEGYAVAQLVEVGGRLGIT